MAFLTVMNAEIESQANALRDRLNLDSTLHLYRGAVPITFEMEPEDFDEADYEGYASVDLTDSWEEPVKRHNGVWSIKTPIFSWTPSGGGPGEPSQVVEGLYLLVAGVVSFAGAFPGPVPLAVGSLPLQFAVEVQLSDGNVFLSLLLVSEV